MTEHATPSITLVQGLTVGHAHDLTRCTGCTVVVCPPGGAAAAAVVRGNAASTRQLGIADPLQVVDRANAVLLAGGSAFGLDAAAGVMRLLAERGLGFATPYATVPIVPTAILYDLGLGDAGARPTPEMAFDAAAGAGPDVAEGCVGAGAGATVGKLFGVRCATKGGLGTWGVRAADGLTVGALVAVNAFGDVLDPGRRAIVAGARRAPDSLELVDTSAQIASGLVEPGWGRAIAGHTNTTLAVVATNARAGGLWLRRIAGWAADGLATCLRPAFTAVDGDVVIALSTEALDAEPHRVGVLAQQVLVRALLRAVGEATPLGGVPSASQLAPLEVGISEI